MPIPLLSTPLPTTSGMTEDQFNASMNLFINELNPYGLGANALAAEVEADAADAAAAVASLAAAVWASGTYALGAVAWSPTDYLNYRCKTAGSRTVDPAVDPTNWALLTKTGAGGSNTTSSAVDIILISTSGRLQIVSMTVASKKVTLPSATTLQTGAPVFVFKNEGAFRFSVHRNGGVFLCYVNPGQVVVAYCSNIGTGAGIWQVGGQNVEQIYSSNTAEVINAVDSQSIATAMLSATKAICAFRNNSTTFLNAVIINYGSASGAVVVINAEATTGVSIAAQTSSQATVVYKSPTGTTKGYVLDNPSGTTITPGAVATIDAGINGTATAVSALSSTQLLCVYNLASGNTPRERVLDISGSVITPSAEVVADATLAAPNVLSVKKVSAAKALVAFRFSTDQSIRLRLQSIAASVPAPTGSVLAIALPGVYLSRMFGLAVLSTTRAILVREVDRSYSEIMITLLDISGTSPTVLRNFAMFANLDIALTATHIDCVKLSANSAYACWTGAQSGGIDALTINITSDDRILASTVTDRTEPGVQTGVGFISVDALDSTHVVQCCRNSATYLSAKTIELS